MGKVTQVNNGDVGLVARTNWNEAMKEVETDSTTLSGDGTTGTPLAVVLLDEDDMASDSATLPATQQSIKAYVDNQVGSVFTTKSYSIGKVPTGIHYVAGYYEGPATDANLTQASTTITLGNANVPYAAHASIVAGGAGSTDGSDLVLTVSGTSITDAGVRTAADSEVIVADATTATTDAYYETVKKWLGQITFTLSSTGGTTFSFDFNYFFSKYEDFGNRDFVVDKFEIVGECNTTDNGYNVQLLLHDDQNWTYSAAAFDPEGTVICDMNVDHGTEQDLDSGEYFAYKKTGLNTSVNGDALEGVLVKITQGANNTMEDANIHIGVDLAPGTIT